MHPLELPALPPQVRLRQEQGLVQLSGSPCACQAGTRCGVYASRPLDCRLYPLDIVEWEGRLWWVIFLNCRYPEMLAPGLEARIPALEAELTTEVLLPFRAQIAVTRSRWAPYAEGRFRLLRQVDLWRSKDG